MTDAIHPTTVPTHFGSFGELDLLCKLIRQEKVIFWVGSGFSSYAGYPKGPELTSLLLADLGELLGETPVPRSLNEVADIYISVKGRDALIELLKEHYGKTPQRFDIHESLALINRIKYIITTNYDSLFEHAYGDRIVKIAHDDELPSSTDDPDKTVLLKIHGDLSDPDSIVITSDDYDKFDKDSIIWGKIKSLLAEYSVVFIGYSVSDSNVEEMLNDIYSRLKNRKHPYFFIDRKIDEKKRKDLNAYNLRFIEMDAAISIDYITGNAIQYAFIDGMKQPPLLSKSDQIFDSRGFRVDPSFTGKKLTHVSLVPMRHDAEIEFTLSLSSKSGEGAAILAFQNFVTGQSVEPVKLSEDECDIEIHDGKMNGIFVFDPSIKKIHEIIITPQPAEIITADLQLQNKPIRLSNLPMKVFKTDSLVKLEIQDPDFTFTLTIPHASREGTINFSARHIISDIERARIIYNFFNSWILGDTIELLTDRLPAPFLIQSSPVVKRRPGNPPIHQLSQLYTDLSDIQNILRVKLQIPDGISQEDQMAIRRVSAFIRGRHQHLNDLSTTFANTKHVRTNIFKRETGVFRLSGEIWDEHLIFGKNLKVPFVVEGSDVIVANEDDVRASIERRDDNLIIKWKSGTGQLYKKFEPPSTVNVLPDANQTGATP
jgi:hypothetical protein